MKRLITALILLTLSALPALAAPTNTSGPWGIDAGGFTNLSTALASPATAGKTVVISKPMAINNKTLPGDRHVKFSRGGRIDPAAGKTFNYAGQDPEAGFFMIHGGAGTVTGLKSSYPDQFGINTIPGVTDMSGAVQKAIKASKHPRLKANTTYLSDRIIIGDSGLLFDCDGTGCVLQAKPTFSVTGLLGGGTSQSFIQVYPTDGVYAWATGGSTIDNVTIRGIEFKGTGGPGTYDITKGGIWVDATNNFTLENSKLSGFQAENFLLSPANLGVSGKLLNNKITGGGEVGFNKVNGWLAEGNEISNSIAQNGLGPGGQNGKAINNYIHDMAIAGMTIGGSGLNGDLVSNILIEGNTIKNCNLLSSAAPPVLFSDDGAVTVPKTNIKFINNDVIGGSYSGLIGLNLLASNTNNITISGGNLSGGDSSAIYFFVGSKGTYNINDVNMIGSGAQQFGIHALDATSSDSNLIINANNNNFASTPYPLHGSIIKAGRNNLNGVIKDDSTVVFGKAVYTSIYEPVWGSAITVDTTLYTSAKIVATSGIASTITITGGTIGQFLMLDIVNSTGGVMGTLTLTNVFLSTPFIAPTSGTRKSLFLYYNGGGWVDVSRT